MFVTMLLVALHAPAPMTPPKSPAQPSLVGEWILEWKGAEGPCVLDQGGGFACIWSGRYWIGTWRIEAGVLTVEEHLPADNEWSRSSHQARWAATLKPGTREGLLTDGGGFKLRKK